MGAFGFVVLMSIPLFIAGVGLLLISPVSSLACFVLIGLLWWLWARFGG